jgi:hypothetical protein
MRLFELEEKEPEKVTDMYRAVARQTDFKGRDLYTTDQNDVVRFLYALKRDNRRFPGIIWEPAAGLGDITKALVQRGGYTVYSSDLYPYEDEDISIAQADFFTSALPAPEGGTIGAIITNPPFNCQEKFLLRALSFNVSVAFFARLSFLASAKRRKIYETNPPRYVYVYSTRASCYKGGYTGKTVVNMIDYAWFIWEPGFTGAPQVYFIP